MTLPKMEGFQPTVGRLKINGLSNTIDSASRPGTKVYFIIEAELEEAKLVFKKNNPVRVETAAIVRHCPIDPTEAIGRLNEHDEEMADRQSNGAQGKLTSVPD